MFLLIDRREENESSIIAVFKTSETASEILQYSINQYAAGSMGTIETFYNGANVICGDDYEVFVYDEMQLSG